MITNTGKGIIAKYLLGQAPAYASYIAVGCGAKPVTVQPTDTPTLNAIRAKQSLDFEMFRVPIISRGFVNEDGVSKLVLTAELPTEERYEISEVGIYSAGSNPAAASFDSRILLGFTQNENWQQHTSYISSIPFIGAPLDTGGTNNELLPTTSATITNASYTTTDITYTASNNFIVGQSVTITGVVPIAYNVTGIIKSVTPSQFVIANSTSVNVAYTSGGTASADAPFFQVNSDNSVFSAAGRSDRYERGRYYNNMIVMRGDMSGLFKKSNGKFNIANNLYHIHLNNIRTDLTKNSPLDELRLAFSVLSKNKDQNPDTINVMLEFTNTEASGSSAEYARMEISLQNNVDGINFNSNRYFIVTKKLQDLVTSEGFSWNSVNIAKAYVSATTKGVINTIQRTGNEVTVTTYGNHGLVVGDTVNIFFDGAPDLSDTSPVPVVTAVTNSTTFKYNTAASGTIALLTNPSNTSTLHTYEKLVKTFYVAFDGLRIENVTTQNPLYGLTGYSLIKTPDASTVVKSPNSNNYIEFRFNLDVT